MLQKTPKRQTNVAFGAVQKHTEKKNEKRSKEGPKEGQKGLNFDWAPNLTSQGNGKRSLESAVKMLISAVIFGICYFVSVFIAICSDLLLFDATCCYLLPLAAARC